MQPPLSFLPERREIDDVPLDTHNKVLEELAKTKEELFRARQKIAHLLKELENK